MSTLSVNVEAISTHQAHEHHDTSGDTVFGFWLYLMTDCLLFASFFATYAVLFMNTAGGVSGKDIFELDFVAIETAALLVSSITFGFAMIAAHSHKKALTLVFLAITFCLGAVFIGMEIYEFQHLIAHGNGPQQSAFLSSFFALVGLHGLHVTAGLIWMTIMMIEVARRGLGKATVTRLSCLSLFWHFLDIVWICVFTVVYLMGAM
ncbi:cytochrome o ubiquinol oxidase subunit III [Colwellia sp. 4_MG-2023]|jgi:cytochrome o ubiquinol oxidase subunit 3|uniref:cytochrome o ubiquinol oxidase subunit III n=1 Tax=unclassified Colwellia TaxID=196834 RepID=UPI001C09F051|nr:MULTISPECIES: cytochrome o ubiquinol oxidase subunit III [unclassified Colwellia]MBU2923562.1 cytochrome o ubiquinol oxidase subunit III [Colwellia sp. C2M11]MDO6486130.1 cytochrome o ubiquinol oxidase subunit III [Colwellia sp. 6_MG-2023]MDO6505910.1 cytochrome o ubiquinol oxidase subunit III [Colwellia sp. 5_MG-2023]MDO6554591.1 cytochrome o ubiquinol oxidase subunit III [Colwellia sp. 4_MG-2023]MDO6653263.1 cytochrome o ubiquinol oxidase subunit III [Colwellia sp. 3_MG-2023]